MHGDTKVRSRVHYQGVVADSSRDGLMQIGQVAERTGLSLRTIRFYEEEGLVVPSKRTEGGFRLYSEADIDRFAVIKRMKPLGFSVEDMRVLLTLLRDLDTGQGDREQLLVRLREFHEEAAARVVQLREQLSIAEGFADSLADSLQARRR
jgi:DNA-binding transcriptional MerR regulator